MKVLLVSPLDPDKPENLKFLMGGENTYTRILLKNPPKGVIYTHFEDALRKGMIEYTFWQKPLSYLIKFRILPLSPGVKCFKVNYPFDLIHIHAYNARLDNYKKQVILSDSSSNSLFLKDYLNWNLARLKLYYLLRKFLHKIFNIYDQDLNLRNAYKLVVFSAFAKKVHIGLGIKSSQIEVIVPGLPQRKIKKIRHRNINILFAGVWFERKGGRVLVEAFNSLNKRYKNLSLIILGPVPKEVNLGINVKQFDFVPYERLINEFYTQADIFVLVPPKAEGFGMVVLEAQSFGIPVIVSKVYALPELIEDGKTGLVIDAGSVGALSGALLRLIVDPNLRKKMGKAARVNFKKKFSSKIQNKKLLTVYNCSRKPRL